MQGISTTARSAAPHRQAAVTKHDEQHIQRPQNTVPSVEIFQRLLQEVDLAWDKARRSSQLDQRTRTVLLMLRQGAEQAASRIARPDAGDHLQLLAVPIIVEMDVDVPESQVDCALRWAAQSAPAAFALQPPAPRSMLTASFLRYRDLTDIPLCSVHHALAQAASDNCLLTALRRVPFRSQPTAARCSPIYLRFVAGLCLDAELRPDGDRTAARLEALEDVVRAVLSARLHAHAAVSVASASDFYRSAHDGLRAYQAAKLNRIIAAVGAQAGVTALLDLSRADTERRVRLALERKGSSVAACMLQMPLDEGPAEMLARLTRCLRDKDVVDIAVVELGGGCSAPQVAGLAVPA
jgi:hypothetical protein